jgi:hypothetical protein
VTLASGTVHIERTKWHHLELRFKGKKIEAMLDGAALASVEDDAHSHGMIALGTEWNLIQFDNLRIAP